MPGIKIERDALAYLPKLWADVSAATDGRITYDTAARDRPRNLDYFRIPYNCNKLKHNSIYATAMVGLRMIPYPVVHQSQRDYDHRERRLRMHKVIKEEWDQKAVDGFKWKHQREAMMLSSFESADNEVLTDAITWRYFLVHLDPYGSPSVFLDSAVQSVADRGMLMCTATGMAVLCGGNREVCYSKSSGEMKNTPLKLSYVYQCVSCDSFHLQPLARTVSKVYSKLDKVVIVALNVTDMVLSKINPPVQFRKEYSPLDLECPLSSGSKDFKITLLNDGDRTGNGSGDEIQALVQKQIDEDMVHQKAILDLAFQIDNACTNKEDLRKAYEKCNHILQESRALIDTFLKEGSDKDYELNLSMYRKAAKLEKQMNAKLAWIHEKYNHRSETHIGGSSSQTHEIGDVYLTAEELHQLHLDEEALRETLEEQTMDEKAREEKIRQKQADDDEYFMEFGVMRIDSDYESSD
ncbi:putative nuclease HARBI1 [Tanacetum coccineum]